MNNLTVFNIQLYSIIFYLKISIISIKLILL